MIVYHLIFSSTVTLRARENNVGSITYYLQYVVWLKCQSEIYLLTNINNNKFSVMSSS